MGMTKMTQVFQKVSAIRGMNDVLPGPSARWEKFEEIVRGWLRSYGYRNVRTPVLEHTRLFARGIGEVTDIVEKEMYTFTDALNGDSLTMRPEMTAGIVRASIEHNMLYDRPHRVYAIGPVFRHERPQRGRYRQFHQIDVEALGFAGPDVDAEMIVMLARLWKLLGLQDVRLELNSLGQPAERAAHRAALIEHLERHQDVLDEDGRRRMYSNPLRVLDTKNPAMQEMADSAPRLFDFLGEASRSHFDGLCQRLADAGIEYRLNPRLVRGLDYYNLTVFEWVTDRLGAQGTVCGGGRYDGLVELLGGKPTPAVGFAIGMERLLDLWEQSVEIEQPAECEVYIVHQGEEGQRLAARVGEQLRDAGLDVIVHAGAAGFKAQFKRADASGARIAVILGGDEVASRTASIKHLRGPVGADAAQQQVPLAQLADVLKSKG
ncbi:histidine--tRNA ligase [Bordetella pertussis H973]|nr:histidine--tRNA ligase [Bordetella pertussis CHLA-11]ETG98807.1 histidine--tRNA ligase [Bordetella pertussis 2250905]ETH05718.1 histidine--tRNA ligase [Bordetella pertussis 2356847]ETH09660.1 histidine--tRNA ligase [Bordetella pertussis 2371640]ETH11007.1 histidine--tRNA ligase [Bordetella pertussis STO1-SEAT-0006]ETH18270.1 histidine--tRNA ligase [Bordetella pertussis CHLA-13]ETH25252.1 histidine--tRNA ligase [Bordetella pertussis CHLA-15]ETH28984.1 histidine--tRNA ligase [Bordetella per